PCDFWIRIQAAQKTQRRGARRSMSGGVLFCTLTRNRLSATKHMSFFSSLLVSSSNAARVGSPTNGLLSLRIATEDPMIIKLLDRTVFSLQVYPDSEKPREFQTRRPTG